MPIFDAYLIVDWSANATPKRGADSIWYCLLRRTKRGLRRTALRNPPTRAQAVAELRQRLLDLVAADRRVLIGFDFPNAYPKGFARRAGFRGVPWRAVWDGVRDLIEDADDNANNRFEVAAELNRRVSGAAYPFWGCPPARTGPYLSMRKTPLHRAGGDVPERRICERYVPSTQPCWKLYTTGSVGGQALTGIPAMAGLCDDPALAGVSEVWPFETGMAAPDPAGPWRVIHAEIYPSMVKVAPGPDEIKDALQVETIGRRFAEIDAADALTRQFTGPDELTAAERRLIEREEGWILGAGTFDTPARDDYLRDPEAIYAQSFATIRREAALDGLPRDIADVAVRLIHACGMTDLVADLAFTRDVARAAKRALRDGAPVLCDSEMTARGIIRRRLPAKNRVLCTLGHKRVPALAAKDKTTRSAAAVDLWRRYLDGAVVAIGNAPTALFRLLELLRDGAPRPAAIIGLPVGFVGAAESKQALIDADLGVPYLTLRGRRGGSAMAAAAVNAIAGAAK